MARRSKAELLAEFHQLYDVFETLQSCRKPLYYGNEEAWVLSTKYTTTRDRMLEWVSEGEASVTDIIEGTRQALNDYLEDIEHAMEDDPMVASEVLALFKERTGRDLFETVGNPRKIAKTIIKRGKIESDTEYYLLNEIMSNVDQSVFKQAQATKAYEMLEVYKARDQE